MPTFLFTLKNSRTQQFIFYKPLFFIMSQPISDYAARRPKSFKIRLSILLGYFQHVAGAPDLPLSDAEIYSIKYLSYPLQQQQNALINYIEELKNIKSPGTVNQYVSTIKDWHKKNKIIFEIDFTGFLCIMSFSAGSTAKANAGSESVTKLIHNI